MIEGILATWRLASLLHREDGPWEIFAQIRDIAGVKYDEQSQAYSDNQIGKMLTCFWCISVWSALVVGLLRKKFNPVEILAYSAGAILVEKVRNG